jgi:hypothetical protein
MSCSNEKTILLRKDYKNQDVSIWNLCQLSIMTIQQTELGILLLGIVYYYSTIHNLANLK